MPATWALSIRCLCIDAVVEAVTLIVPDLRLACADSDYACHYRLWIVAIVRLRGDVLVLVVVVASQATVQAHTAVFLHVGSRAVDAGPVSSWDASTALATQHDHSII